MRPGGLTETPVVCAPDHDITLRSSDNVLFQVHVVNLQMHSDGFAAGAGCSGTDRGPSPPETVPLTETAATLDLLLQYMYLQPQPDLSTVSFEELAGLAEAAEKYQVYAAIPICKVHMEYAMREHPFNVIAYAARHSYIDMANKAALLTFGAPLLDAVDNLPPQYMRAWVRVAAFCSLSRLTRQFTRLCISTLSRFRSHKGH
ncbi:hypothetical protein PLICRDRAFT_96319 [Plicaturopsis crispa FD-325 SS-3]|nr:hypothetical protein PLICRDRAFT_96319 [Plicaturopsis crispa FD-325 SS-3]